MEYHEKIRLRPLHERILILDLADFSDRWGLDEGKLREAIAARWDQVLETVIASEHDK